MKRKSYLICFTIFLLPLITYFLYLFLNSLISREKIYYIPEAEMYIKTIIVPKNYYGYILFGKSDDIVESDSIDYIILAQRLSHEILVDPVKKNNIYLEYDIMERIKENQLVNDTFFMYDKKNPVFYSMIDIATTDTCFFNEYEKYYHVSKNSYISIVFDEHFNEVKVRNAGDSVYKKLLPMR
ncbi:MAG: hypothetical protein FWF52_02960 [Candidatus Azobacteroides sp.]|nr:hypothetical protein [Candidatus Azobacteroides sp.]